MPSVVDARRDGGTRDGGTESKARVDSGASRLGSGASRLGSGASVHGTSAAGGNEASAGPEIGGLSTRARESEGGRLAFGITVEIGPPGGGSRCGVRVASSPMKASNGGRPGDENRAPLLGRRAVIGGAAGLGLAGAAGALFPSVAEGRPAGLVAKAPAGFLPMVAPGRVARVQKANAMQGNGLWPTQDAANLLLTRVMAELTGKQDLAEALKKFVHPSDKVAIKPNGLAGRTGATMATNKELVLALVRGLVAAGVPATSIVIYEQWESFMAGTRCADKKMVVDAEFPAGVTAMVHQNKDSSMEEISAAGGKTRYARPFTDATCVINLSQMKDHSICGFTGALKNITHGSVLNPQDFHAHDASPQIAQLYSQDIVRSRVRLHIADATKVIYEGGPGDKPARRVLQEAVYASTDPVALDVVGCELIEKLRKDNSLPTLKAAGRAPTYIQNAGELGLGIYDRSAITLRDVAI